MHLKFLEDLQTVLPDKSISKLIIFMALLYVYIIFIWSNRYIFKDTFVF